MIRHLFLIVSLMLTACSLHPKYAEPVLKLPTQWHAPVAHGADMADLSNWWQQFDDDILIKLQSAAQQNNPSLAIAAGNIQAARANLSLTTGRLYPRLNGNAQSSERQSGNAGGSGRIESQSANLDASWELNFFGARTFSKRAAIAQLDASDLDWHQARVSLAAEVATQYIQYRACESALNIRQQSQTSLVETARLVKITADAGFTAPADAALAQANAASSQSAYIAQKTNCALLLKSLTTLTQLDEAEVQQLLATKTAVIPKPQHFLVTALPANLIKQRPDIAANERTLAAASAQIGVAKAALYPSITLNGSIGYQRTVFNNFSFKTNTWSFGPAINIPIFDGGQRKAQVRLNEAEFEIALANFKQSVNQAVQEVEQALVQLDGATQRVELESIAVEQAQQFFEASKINWEAGGLALLDLEEARRQYINAQESLILQQRDRVLFWVALYKAFGGDWQAEADETMDESH